MKKVLFFIESLNGGGAERVLTTLIENIDQSVFDVVVCSICRGVYSERIESNVRYLSLLDDSKSISFFSRFCYRIKYNLIYHILPLHWVYRLWIPQNADIEIAFVEGFATKLIAHSTNSVSKKLTWVHCDMKRDHWTRQVFQSNSEEKHYYQQYDEIITVSQTQKESMHQLFGDLPVRVCYNPIDSESILRLADSLEGVPVKSSQSGLRLVASGRLAQVKGFDRLIQIVARLKCDNFPVELWILGDGDERRYLEKKLDENHLQSVVTLWGFQSNPYKYMAQCDLFVCSSLSEGFSTAITEALILGLPVVSTEVSGVREQLEGGREKCGLITENSEEGLYHGVKLLLEQPELRNSLAIAARERGKDFQIKQLMSAIEKELIGL